MATERWILHADMDAFYASVEQRDHPEYRGKPVIVGAVGERGVVSAASYEARTFGVRSAMPGYQARQLCPQGIFLPGNMKKYAGVSRQVHEIFQHYTDKIEPLALDEAFLDIGGSLKLFGSPESIGRAIKDRVRDELGLIISVGIAPNKLVAKIACSQGKPDGLRVVQPEDVRNLLNPLPVRALWGVGPKAETQLKAKGFVTIGDIANAPLSRLKGVFGDHAADMQRRARGQDEREVEGERVAKSIGEEATFADNVSDEARIISAITSHAEAVASRARRSDHQGRTVVLKVKLARRRAWGDKIVSNHELFRTVSRQTKLDEATADGMVIQRAAVALWKKLELQEPIRLLGVTLTDLVDQDAPQQLDLFGAPMKAPVTPLKPAEKKRQSGKKGESLGRTLDAIADKFGDTAIGRGAGKISKITASDKLKLGDTEQTLKRPPQERK